MRDDDEPHSAAWNSKFKIIDGDPANLFTVKTGTTNKQEGIISTIKVGGTVGSYCHTWFKLLKLFLFLFFLNNLSCLLAALKPELWLLRS